MNMPFILSSEAKNAYFMNGEATNEINFFLASRDEIASTVARTVVHVSA